MGWFYFVVGVITLAAIYAGFAMSLNLISGWGGLWDLGPAGIIAVAAYVYVITTADPAANDLAINLGWPIWAGVLAAAVSAGLVALAISIPATRLRGEYFLITTFAFAEIIRQIIIVQDDVTGGASGLARIDRPFDGVVQGADYRYVLLGLVLLVVGLLYLFMRRLSRAPFIRVLRASRDNEAVAMVHGKNVKHLRVQTFVIGGVVLGLIAPLYVWYLRAIVPGLFVTTLTFVIWVSLVVGGIGNVRGPLLGAGLLLGVTEGVQVFQGSADTANLLAASLPFILGVVIIGVMRFLPEGILSERRAFRNASGIVGLTR